MKNIVRILRFATELRPYYLAIGALSIIVALIGQAQPFITKTAIDQLGLDNPSAGLLIGLVVVYFLSDFALNALGNIGGYLGDMMSIKLRRILSERYYEHLLILPQRYFDNQRTGSLVNKLSRSIENLTQTMQFFSNNALQLVLTTVMTISICAFFSPAVALLMALLYPTLFKMTTRTSDRWQKLEHRKNEHLDNAFGRFTEVVAQMRVVKSFRQGPRELGHFAEDWDEVIPLTSSQSRFWHRQDVMRQGLLNIVFVGIFGVIVWQTYRGDLTIGEMVLLLQYTMIARRPLFALSFIVDSAQKAIAGSRDFFEVMELDTEETINETQETIDQIPQYEASVQFDNVTFAYEDLEVIHNLSFKIPAGQKLALVSESGGGKTTLSNMLIGLYKASEGTIKIGGRDVASETLGWTRQQIGVVFQDADLFSGTVKENIAYANDSVSDSAMKEAAIAANADEFIRELPDGYDTQIGERGVKLSGGQKQRIAIARALLKDAPILILDEATSALDSKTEIEVQAALDRLMEGRTSLVIAHRLSTIAGVDQILTLSQGRIEEIGSPTELANSGGTYSKLLALQNATPEQRKDFLEQFDLQA